MCTTCVGHSNHDLTSILWYITACLFDYFSPKRDCFSPKFEAMVCYDMQGHFSHAQDCNKEAMQNIM